MSDPYLLAQEAMGKLRSAIYLVLQRPRQRADKRPTWALIGCIYSGHVGHEGHISRTILALMEEEGVWNKSPKLRFGAFVRTVMVP